MSVLLDLILQLLKALPKEVYVLLAGLAGGAGFVLYLRRRERKLTEQHNKVLEEGKHLLVEHEKETIEDTLRELNESLQTKLSKGLTSSDVQKLLKDRSKN